MKLTTKGQQAHDRLLPIVQDVMDAVLRGFSSEQRRTACSALKQVRANLRDEGSRRCGRSLCRLHALSGQGKPYSEVQAQLMKPNKRHKKLASFDEARTDAGHPLRYPGHSGSSAPQDSHALRVFVSSICSANPPARIPAGNAKTPMPSSEMTDANSLPISVWGTTSP